MTVTAGFPTRCQKQSPTSWGHASTLAPPLEHTPIIPYDNFFQHSHCNLAISFIQFFKKKRKEKKTHTHTGIEVWIKVNHHVPKLCLTSSIRLLPMFRHAHLSDEAIFTNLHCINSLHNIHSLFPGLYNSC